MKKEYGMVMEFIDPSPEFTNGFECGLIWQKLNDGNVLTGYTVHTENSAQIQMICDHFNVPCVIKPYKSDSSWAELSTTKDERPHDFIEDEY
jgi:hypothetical protein